jgi:dUTP pyrophosphatase
MKIKLEKWAYMPERAYETDAGADLRTPIDVTLKPHEAVTIDTGVHVELPMNTVGMVKSKSGLNVKHGIVSEGVIDVGYTGSIRVKLYNHSDHPHHFKAGDKISQLVIMPILIPDFELVAELEETDRGEKGFGSSGR